MHPHNRQVAQTLGIATACMFTIPLITFYAARYCFRDRQEPDNFAAAAAVLMVNVVVAAYCFKAFREGDDDDEKEKKGNDDEIPRVGAFKKRTD